MRVLSNLRSIHKIFERRNREINFNIIQSTGSHAIGFYTAKKSNVPVVTRLSFYRQYWSETRDKYVEKLEKKQRKYSSAVYTPSKLIANIVSEKENIKVDEIKPFFKLKKENWDYSIVNNKLQERKYLLYFGKLNERKGIKVLANALKISSEKGLDLNFVFVGEQKKIDEKNALQYIKEKARDINIQHIDVLSHKQLFPVIEKAFAVVMPSVIDNIPNSCLEAMSLGKVIVASSNSSLDELIEDNVSGYLFENRNPASLADIIIKVWNMSREKFEKAGLEAEKRVKQIASEKQIEVLENYFKKIIS